MTDQNNVNGGPKRVVVVDDHILFREGLISLFSSASDFKVVGEAGSVQEGVERVRTLQPDLVLMDFSLPDGTGLDATQVILKEIPNCKIVFLTVHEANDKLFAAIRAGAKGYLPKNVAGKNLISSLRALDRDEMALSRKMSSRIVEEFSQSTDQNTLSDEILKKLSPRELDVLCEMELGVSNSEIAQRLFLSENTIKHHVRNILSKLGVKNRREASLISQKAGLKSKLSEKLE